jgi:5'-nucleotidase
MRILLTNDDGIYAPGIRALARPLETLGTVSIVAPESAQSASGHGITLHSPLITTPAVLDEQVRGIAVDGRPADCVKLAINQLLPERPDLVISGINFGANVGINVLYSGTVAAAIEAAFLGVPSIAVSLLLQREHPVDWSRVSAVAVDSIRHVLELGLDRGSVASVNIPAIVSTGSHRGFRVVRQCTRPWNDTYDRRTDPRGRDYYWNSSVFSLGTTEDDTDVAALREGFVTITPLEFDLTNHETAGRWAAKSAGGAR